MALRLLTRCLSASPSRRPHSRRLPLQFDPDCGARSRFQAGRGGAAVVSSRAAGNHLGRREGNMGAPQNSPRRARLVSADLWLDRGIDFGVFRHLGPNAHPRTVLDLAFRRLSIRARHRHPRWSYNGVASVTIEHKLFARLAARSNLPAP